MRAPGTDGHSCVRIAIRLVRYGSTPGAAPSSAAPSGRVPASQRCQDDA